MLKPEKKIAELLRNPIWATSLDAGAGESGMYIDPSPGLGGILFYSASDTYNPEDGTGSVRVRLHEDGLKLYADAQTAATSNIQFIHSDAGGVIASMFGYYNSVADSKSLILQTDDTISAGQISQILIRTADTSTRSVLQLVTDLTSTLQYLKVFAASGTFNGFTVGADDTPDAMLDVRGDAIITGSLTVNGSVGSGAVAPSDAQYVTLAVNGTLTNERVLTGTSNQIAVTDNGAGSTVVLSTPQNIHTSATPQFTRMGLGKAANASYALEALQVGAGIQNTASLTNTQTAAANVGARLLFVGSSDTGIAGIAGAWEGAATTNSYLTLYTRQSNVFTEAIRITSSNFVGIAETAPKSKLHITGASGWIIQDEQDTNPTTTELDADDSIAIYNKADTFVIAYNNGGTMTYITIPLDGSTTTWTHSTSAP